MFDDYVLAPNLASYLLVASDRGAERITLKKLGPVKEALGKPKEHMKGADSLTPRRDVVPLESFIKKRRRSHVRAH